MGSSWPFFASTLLLFLIQTSASIEEQREITFELEDGEPILQRAMNRDDLLDSFDPSRDMLQRQVDLEDRLGSLDHPAFRPRSIHPHPMEEYPVQFPLGRPTMQNLDAICLHSEHRPRYPASYFPASSFSENRRQASSVNRAEFWFGTCCAGNETWSREVVLCCATRAWMQSLKLYCKEDSQVKNPQHQCCGQNASALASCFNSKAPNPNYEPTEELPVSPLSATPRFNFARNSCLRSAESPANARGKQRKAKTPASSKKVNIIFPLGRPSADSIESLCRYQSQRPLYSVKCLPAAGYELLAHQAVSVNRLERGFKVCCRKNNKIALHCAKRKWSSEVDKFCANKGEKLDFHCCSGESAEKRYDCFQNISRDPHYNMTAEQPSLDKLCDTHKIIKKKFPVSIPLKPFVEQCCPLSGDQETNNCSMKKVQQMSRVLCSSGKSTPAVRRCCRMSAEEAPRCMSRILVSAITKATRVLQQSKKRKCPIS